MQHLRAHAVSLIGSVRERRKKGATSPFLVVRVQQTWVESTRGLAVRQTDFLDFLD